MRKPMRHHAGHSGHLSGDVHTRLGEEIPRPFFGLVRPWVPLFVSTGLFLAAACGPPIQASLTIGNADVDVNADAGTITVRRGDEVVWRSAASDWGQKKGSVFYDMQFGMFDIQEDQAAFRFADRLEIKDADDDAIRFSFFDAEDLVGEGVVEGRPGDQLGLTITTAKGDQQILNTPCASDHHFIGLGAQSADVDHRGQVVPLWVSEQGIGKSDSDELPTVWQLLGRRHTTHAPMPMMVRSDAVAVVVDTSAFARFDLCATDVDVTSLEVWEDTLRLTLVVEDTVLAAQQALVAQQGRTRLLAPYTFAPWNDAIFSEQNVRDFAAFLRDNEIPSSVIWSEDWRGGQNAGELYRLDEDWRLDRDVYPTYEDMAADLKADGFAHQVYFNTFVTEGGDVFDEVTSAKLDVRRSSGEPYLFTGADREFSPTALLDLTNPAAITLMKEDHLKEALRLGARGWMADYAEWMPVDDAVLSSGEDPALVHNRYAVDWARINREAVSEAGLLDEVVLFSRSGHFGSPKVVDVFWAGDQRTSFQVDDGLPTIIPLGIGTAVTGFDVYAHDIAGYQSTTNDPANKELFFRWTELGAFSPVMRTHHGTHARFNHNLQSDDESTAHWKRYAEIHTRLYPYLRALHLAAAAGAKVNGVAVGAVVGNVAGPLPLWVPMPLLHPKDDAVWAVRDQVYLGPSLLVAPVVTEGEVRRDITLPAGRFVPFAMPGAEVGTLGISTTAFVGPDVVTVNAARGEIPVLMPAGGIVPMTAQAAQTLLVADGMADLRSTEGDRVVVIALGASGSFVEESGARYELKGTGTTLPAGVDAEGGVDVVGNAILTEDGYTLTLSGHPTTRNIRLIFR